MSKLVAGVGTAIIAGLLLVGCSKSTSPGGTAPVLKAPTFAGPSSTSATADTSQGAATAKQYASLFNAYVTGYLGFYTANGGTQSGNTWTWTYTQIQGFTATWSATSSSNGYNWKLVYNGTLTSGGSSETFSNWTVLNGNETTDGKSGSWTLYYVNSTIAAYAVTWSTSSTGTLTGTIIVNDTTGAQVAKQVFTNNTDKSGELVVYEGPASGAVQVLDVKWTSTGSGTWTSFDPTTGETNSGSWS